MIFGPSRPPGAGARGRPRTRIKASLGRCTPFCRRPAAGRDLSFDVATLAGVVLETPARDVECPPQDEPGVLLRAVPGHGDFLSTHLDVDPDSEIVAALAMTMRDVGDDMAGDDSRAERVQFICALADLSFNGGTRLSSREM